MRGIHCSAEHPVCESLVTRRRLVPSINSNSRKKHPTRLNQVSLRGECRSEAPPLLPAWLMWTFRGNPITAAERHWRRGSSVPPPPPPPPSWKTNSRCFLSDTWEISRSDNSGSSPPAAAAAAWSALPEAPLRLLPGEPERRRAHGGPDSGTERGARG